MPFNFVTLLLVLNTVAGYIPVLLLKLHCSSCLGIPLLIIIIILVSAAVICTASRCLTDFAYPFLTSLAYYSFGTITWIKMQTSILESTVNASLLGSRPSCLRVLYPFSLLFLFAPPKSGLLGSPRQGTYIGL